MTFKNGCHNAHCLVRHFPEKGESEGCPMLTAILDLVRSSRIRAGPPIRVDRGLRWLRGVEPEARAERSDNLDGPPCEWNGTGNWRPTMAQRRRTERSLRRRIPRR